MTAKQINMWALGVFALGVMGGLYIMLMGAPDPVLSEGGKRTVQWYLHYGEETIGRFGTGLVIIASSGVISLLTLLTPIGWTEFSD